MLACGQLLVDVRAVTAAEYQRFVLAMHGRLDPEAGDTACAQVSHREAMMYAAWAGKRLPNDSEWTVITSELGARLHTGEVWEWTTTKAEPHGFVVRGGRWRTEARESLVRGGGCGRRRVSLRPGYNSWARMRYLVAFALLGSAGCDVVFGIDRMNAPDAQVCDPHDEDEDGFGNACDLCPADHDNGNDGDQDFVGDACDPDPSDPGDHLVLFDGFDTNTNPWMIASGDWHLDGGAFVQTTASDARVALPIAAEMPTVEAIIPTYELGSAGSVTVFGASGLSEVRCSVAMAGGEVLHLDTIVDHLQVPVPADAGPLRIVGGQHHDGRFYCSARHGDNFDVELQTAMFALQAIDSIGLASNGASATVTSISVYDVP
jgi:hypothetical protein